MSLSDYSENICLDHGLGTTQCPTTTDVYLALFTDDPTDAGTGTEVSGGSYAREVITFAAATGRSITQTGDVEFTTATGNWGTVTHYAIYTLLSGGEFLASGQLGTSKSVTDGKTPSVASGEVIISFDTGVISNYLAVQLLDRIFRNQSATLPVPYMALIETTDVTDSTAGSALDELEMTDYAREAIGTFPGASGGATQNSALIDFGTLTGTGETLTATAICDSSGTGTGNVLFYDNTPNATIADGDSVEYAIGDYDIAMT